MTAQTVIGARFLKNGAEWGFKIDIYRLLVPFWMIVYMIAIGQDYLGTSINNTSFYISESALFNSFWLVFIPISFVFISHARKGYVTIFSNSSMWIAGIFFCLILSSIHLVLFSAVINIISRVAWIHTFDFMWVLNETFTEDFYLVFSLYGLVLFMTWRDFKLKKQITEGSPSYIDTLTIRNGKTLVPIKAEDIQWIGTDHPYIAIRTSENTYLHSSSLTNILKKLDPDRFARIHRSTIINMDKVVELTSRLNGDYDITMEDGTIVRLSRNYSQDVKDRLL